MSKRLGDKGYIWTFLGHDDTENADFIAYRYSDTRSGDTPYNILGSTTGSLVVDAYSGYNRVTIPEGRVRAGCLAHVRRKFFDAESSAPEDSTEAMALILRVYEVEAKAKHFGLIGTKKHLELREHESKQHMSQFHSWLIEKQAFHPPKSAMGKSIAYTLAQWETLLEFLGDAKIPLDNNAAERALRVVALGRKNYLFAGTSQSAENLAGLYAVISTCEACGVNPTDYIADVLLRTDNHVSLRARRTSPTRLGHRPDPARVLQRTL